MEHARQAYLAALAAGDSPALARALRHVSAIAFEAGDVAQARQAGDEALGLAEELGDPAGIGRCRLTIGANHLACGAPDAALAWARSAADAFRSAGDAGGVAEARLLEGEALVSQASAGAAGPVLAAALEAFRSAGSEQLVARAAALRALVLAREGRRADAADLVREAFDVHAAIGHPWSVAHDLDVVATLRADAGDCAGAAGLLAAAARVRTDAGLVPWSRDVAVRAAVEARCREALGAAAFRTASTKAEAVDLERGVSLARSWS
jgi:tetratricopeptide (TPR) repeat protein